MPKMRAIQVPSPKAGFEIVEREIPEPGPGSVRIKVQACGICHSDTLTKDGTFPLVQYPRVPGHEVVGVVDAVASGVSQWVPGQRVGVGWHGGNCGYCDACRRGDFFACETFTAITGVTADGGYAEYTVADQRFCFAIPEKYTSVEAAPLLCAGLIKVVQPVVRENQIGKMLMDFLQKTLLGLNLFGVEVQTALGQLVRHQDKIRRHILEE